LKGFWDCAGVARTPKPSRRQTNLVIVYLRGRPDELESLMPLGATGFEDTTLLDPAAVAPIS
jgi:hypothetical protein